MKSLALLPFLLAIALCSIASSATLEVQPGWTGQTRPGRWTPFLLTLSDPQQRQVTLELYLPDEGNGSSVIREEMGIGPEKNRYLVYAPLGQYGWRRTALVVRDPKTGQRLACYPSNSAAARAPLLQSTGQLIGVSGRAPMLQILEISAQPDDLCVGFIDIAALPTAWIGYDALDLLVLNAPNLNRLRSDQQEAIVEWVRTGGNLLLWSSDDTVPSTSPLIDVLPCTVGAATTQPIDSQALRELGLAPELSQVAARSLLPKADAEAIPIFGRSGPRAFARREGLGRIVLSPIDLGHLQFETPRQAVSFWRPLLRGMIELPQTTTNPLDTPLTSTTIEGAARDSIRGALGGVAVESPFHFRFAPLALCVLLLLGPANSIHRRMLGRRPFNLFTGIAWIAMLASAGQMPAERIASRRVECSSASMSDQAGDRMIQTTVVARMNAGRTRWLAASAAPDQWWQTLPTGERAGYAPAGTALFHESPTAALPASLYLRKGGGHYLLGRTIPDAPLVLESALWLQPQPQGPPLLAGTLRNVGVRPFKLLQISAGDSVYVQELDLAPGASASINISGRQPISQPTAILDGLEHLDARALDRFAQLRSESNLAIVYGEFTDGKVPLRVDPAPSGKHRSFLRALVPLDAPKK